MNQEQNGGQWNLLGTFSLTPSSGDKVVLSDNTSELAIADAVMFVRDDQTTGDVVIDNDDAGASSSGDWGSHNGTNGGPFLGTDFSRQDDPQTTDSFTWPAAVPTLARYRVYVRYPHATSFAPAAVYTVTHDGGSDSVTLDQRVNGGRCGVLRTGAVGGGAPH